MILAANQVKSFHYLVTHSHHEEVSKPNCGIIFQKGLSSTLKLRKINISNLRRADEGKESIRCLVPDDAFVFSECTCFWPPWTSLPPSLLKSLTFSTAVLVLIFFIVVVIGVQDRSVRVGIIGLVFPLAFVL